MEDFCYTRYPNKRIHFHNAGVSGDSARHALERFEEDVAAYKPKAVSILLGMNDGRYRPFDQAIFDTYQAGMTALLDRISATGALAIPITPTMHDARAARLASKAEEPRDTFYNGVLSLFGSWLREMAYQRGLGFADMYSPLNQITLEQRRSDPRWTMIKDAVHPGPVGQFVMAAALVEDAFPKSEVGSITLQLLSGSWSASSPNAQVSDVSGGTTPAFTVTYPSLPWVVPPDAAEGYQLVHAGHRMSVEKFAVQNLPPGSYLVKVDGTEIGTWNESALARGIETEEIPATPQYQQALQVAQINKRRNEEAYRPLRNEFSQLKARRKKIETSPAGPERLKLEAELETWRSGMRERVQALRTKARELEDEIYRINQPKPRRYEILPTQP
ncbi:MAG: hypothetical protein RLZZ142_776 [Verrucomicrobiota bacterium]